MAEPVVGQEERYDATGFLTHLVPAFGSWRTQSKHKPARPQHLAKDDIEAIVADMHLTHPTLCDSINPGSNIQNIFSTQMLSGSDQHYLQLLAATIAVRNADTKLKESSNKLEQLKKAQAHQLQLINEHETTITSLRAEVSSYKHDQIHLANEAWGYGHAETRGPPLDYNSVNVLKTMASPLPPQVKSAETFEDHHSRPSTVIVTFP